MRVPAVRNNWSLGDSFASFLILCEFLLDSPLCKTRFKSAERANLFPFVSKKKTNVELYVLCFYSNLELLQVISGIRDVALVPPHLNNAG